MEWLAMYRWSPYAVGFGIGVLCWVTFLLSNKPLGVSTTFARMCGKLLGIFFPNRIQENPYYQKIKTDVDWQWMLVMGLFVGALISAAISGQLNFALVPSRWQGAFGSVALYRIVVAFIGGVIMGIGARWADGCTSGHGISGFLQLAPSSIIAVICFFASGVLVAKLLFL